MTNFLDSISSSFRIHVAVLIVSVDFVQKTQKQYNKQTFTFTVIVHLIIGEYSQHPLSRPSMGPVTKLEVVNARDNEKNRKS